MIALRLFGCAEGWWCTVHKLRLPGRICPKCGPRVVGERRVSDHEYTAAYGADGHCDTCGYHVCCCPPKLDSFPLDTCVCPGCLGASDDFWCGRGKVPLQQAARELTADERQGADREGWRQSVNPNCVELVDTHVYVYKPLCEVLQAGDGFKGTWFPTLLDAQRAAEQLAADSRDGWERGSPTSMSYRMGRSGLAYMNLNHTWNAVVWGGKVTTGHPTAVAAMLEVERALQERDT